VKVGALRLRSYWKNAGAAKVARQGARAMALAAVSARYEADREGFWQKRVLRGVDVREFVLRVAVAAPGMEAGLLGCCHEALSDVDVGGRVYPRANRGEGRYIIASSGIEAMVAVFASYLCDRGASVLE
jgi:hypothetical protein